MPTPDQLPEDPKAITSTAHSVSAPSPNPCIAITIFVQEEFLRDTDADVAKEMLGAVAYDTAEQKLGKA